MHLHQIFMVFISILVSTTLAQADENRPLVDRQPNYKSHSVNDPVSDSFIKSWCSDPENDCSKADRKKAKDAKKGKEKTAGDEEEKVIADPSCDSNPLVNC